MAQGLCTWFSGPDIAQHPVELIGQGAFRRVLLCSSLPVYTSILTNPIVTVAAGNHRFDQGGALQWRRQMWMELAENVEDLVKVVANLLVWLDRDQQAELRRAFKEWLGQILSRNEVPGIDMGAIHDLTEMHDMLNERIREWGRPYREEGLRLGREEGIELGEARLLKRQLTKRFGQLPAWAEQRIEEATTDQLERWSEQILDADSIEAVFA
jgi:hypothetical protein